ncbi:MAG TPA: 6-phospho-beta-glucosidase [Chloroflexota bacterium]|nr:6-phospho-beta-glucosidase [Chloroflexota bacterium]
MSERAYKITVIGAGSTYTPELVEGLIDRHESLPVRDLTFVDINEDRLQNLTEMARRMIKAADLDFTVTPTTDRRRGIEGADFVLNQIRVGGQPARIRDEKMGRRHDVVGQETTGPGGFAKALRTIPVALSIAADIRRLAPDAWMINFTNPAGMVTESLLRYGEIKVMGLCNGPYGTQVQIARVLDATPERVKMDVVGLNHLSWVRTVYLDGQDVTDRLIDMMVEGLRDHDDSFDASLIANLRMVPSGYLRYFYHQQDVLAHQREGGKTRGEVVWEIEQNLLEQYRDPELCCKPPLLAKRGGAYYSTLAVSLVDSIANDRQDVHIVDCRNTGAIADLPDDVAVEVPAVISGHGAQAITAGHLPWSIRGLVQHVKAYEELTIEAAITGSERAALLALLNNPLVPDWSTAQALWKDILEENADYLPQFTRGREAVTA